MTEARRCQVEKRKIKKLNILIDAKEVVYNQQLKLIREQQSLIEKYEAQLPSEREIMKLKKTIALLSSMVYGGENHSNHSEKAVNIAYKILDKY